MEKEFPQGNAQRVEKVLSEEKLHKEHAGDRVKGYLRRGVSERNRRKATALSAEMAAKALLSRCP